MARSDHCPGDRGAAAVAAVVALQAIAAAFFLADATADIGASGATPHVVIEAIIALALVAGVVTGALQVRRMWREARRRRAALAVAAGALSEVMAQRFREWRLTPAEADVAVFALKGCDIAQICELRGSAAGTVRAQLTRVYDKAGVNSRAALASLFLEDLMSAPIIRPGRDDA
ncbi:helix-turn-helix transcriptional regulator [Phenylobacterium aquaticum]|uniref:helix-turn-helix transcriptional regulator n=1 Tax=Phenylobacterium aquaticum TaxID=1763816 RepID=UPI001F5C52BA|nr:helix-turn-helix transcriptional regulator [Phenylobacterium aquaticum]MCI3133293.1 helix-turn-helix transcriptional regulator [Phenylobacterium aquaticum]